MLTRELRAELSKIFVENKEYKNLYISVLSFGFKYGIPADADLVFDVRFLPNPYYIDELRPKSGNDKEVREYVMDNDKASRQHCRSTAPRTCSWSRQIQHRTAQALSGCNGMVFPAEKI